jgi:Raf kinase inhibitor-like YbhB/YbcL family protein
MRHCPPIAQTLPKPCPTALDSRGLTSTSGESDPNRFEPNFQALTGKVACRLELLPTPLAGFESLPLRFAPFDEQVVVIGNITTLRAFSVFEARILQSRAARATQQSMSPMSSIRAAHRQRIAFIPLVVLSALGTLHCGSSNTSSGGSGGETAQAGSNASGGTSVGGTSVGGSSVGGASVGSGGSAGSAGAAQGGSAGASAGAAGIGGGGGSSAGAAGQGGGGSFMLSSSKLAAGAVFPTEYTCASSAEHSLPLSWTAGPSATLSYALVLQDTNNLLNHWVVWDIPPATTLLPESLPTDAALSMPAGAKQRAAQGMGYLGPCPNGTQHTYVFTLYALDVATVPGVMASTTTMSLAAAIQMHDLASATLSGTSNAKMP